MKKVKVKGSHFWAKIIFFFGVIGPGIIAANADNAAISIPTDKYIAQLTGFEIPYHIVTCEIDTNATIIIGITNAETIIVL